MHSLQLNPLGLIWYNSSHSYISSLYNGGEKDITKIAVLSSDHIFQNSDMHLLPVRVTVSPR